MRCHYAAEFIPCVRPTNSDLVPLTNGPAPSWEDERKAKLATTRMRAHARPLPEGSWPWVLSHSQHRTKHCVWNGIYESVVHGYSYGQIYVATPSSLCRKDKLPVVCVGCCLKKRACCAASPSSWYLLSDAPSCSRLAIPVFFGLSEARQCFLSRELSMLPLSKLWKNETSSGVEYIPHSITRALRYCSTHCQAAPRFSADFRLSLKNKTNVVEERNMSLDNLLDFAFVLTILMAIR